ncbi:MAG: T9SS type A sorting domain-containing protein [Candidatus Hydrothermales bacterium]
MSKNKKVLLTVFLVGFLFAGTIRPIVKDHLIIDREDFKNTSDIYPSALPTYPTIPIAYIDTMPNQYSTLYTAPKPINTSPDQSCVFFTYRRLSDNPAYPGTGRLALVFSQDGGNTWTRIWPYNIDGAGRYPNVGPWMGNSDTFILTYSTVRTPYEGAISTVPSDGALPQGNIYTYFIQTPGFVGYRSFGNASNDMGNFVNFLVGQDNNYFTHWWWRLAFIDPDPPATLFPNHPGDVWLMDYLGGTLAALVGPDTVKVSNDDGATWTSIPLYFNVPVDTFRFQGIDYIVDYLWYVNYWDFALLNSTTPMALLTTTCYFTNPIVFGTDTFVSGNGAYLVTPTATYTIIDPDDLTFFANIELTIDHVRNILFVTYVAYHTIDYVPNRRYGWTDVYVKYSLDGGATWSAPYNITRDEANQPTDDKIEHKVHTIKHVFTPSNDYKLWLLFNVPRAWDGANAGLDIHYNTYALGGTVPTYILTGYIPVTSIFESSKDKLVLNKLTFNGNVFDKGAIRFVSPLNGKMVFDIFDVSGKRITSKTVSVKEGNNEIKVSNLKSGIYFLKYKGDIQGNLKLVVTE